LGDDVVLIVACPAHPTNVVQAFDFVFCGAMKRLSAAPEGEFTDDCVSDEITRVVRACQQTVTLTTVRGSFPKAGLVPDISVRVLSLTTEEDKIRENTGFGDVGDGDIEIEHMSRSRQAH
jgi:hypothetical protein